MDGGETGQPAEGTACTRGTCPQKRAGAADQTKSSLPGKALPWQEVGGFCWSSVAGPLEASQCTGNSSAQTCCLQRIALNDVGLQRHQRQAEFPSEERVQQRSWGVRCFTYLGERRGTGPGEIHPFEGRACGGHHLWPAGSLLAASLWTQALGAGTGRCGRPQAPHLLPISHAAPLGEALPAAS